MIRTKTFLAAAILEISSLFCMNAEKIVFSADSMSGIVGDKSDSTTLSGEAYVLTDTMEISADSISMSGKDFRFIDATGSVTGKNTESQLEFTCGRLKYDRETKVAQLMDNVDLLDVKNNVKAKAQMIEYNQETDTAVMQIEIELKQKDNTCTGAYAIYRKADQMLELSGNSQIKQGQDTFRAQEITLNLDSQEITLDGRVKGSIVDERKSSKNEEETAESKDSSKESDTLSENDNAEKQETAAEEPAVNPTETAANPAEENKEPAKAETKTESKKNKSKKK